MLLPTQKPAVQKEPCGKRAERKEESGAVDHRGIVRNLFFSESNRYRLPAPKSLLHLSSNLMRRCLSADEHIEHVAADFHTVCSIVSNSKFGTLKHRNKQSLVYTHPH